MSFPTNDVQPNYVFTAERVQFYAQQKLSDVAPMLAANMKANYYESMLGNGMLTFYSWCAAGRVPSEPQTRTIQWPDGPWQAFKERYFPYWLRERFPVRWKSEVVTTQINTYFVCPHVHVPDQGPHVQFMATGQPIAHKMRSYRP